MTFEESVIIANQSWEYFCDLRKDHTGQLVTPKEYEESQQRLKEEQQRLEQARKEQGNIRQWIHTDYETLNTLLIQYKQTGDQSYFEEAWDKYLEDLTYTWVKKYLVEGLPTFAKQIFLDGDNYNEIQDELYIVLVTALEKWTPNAPDRYTRDFAAFYKQAVYDYVGGYKTRLKRPKYSNVKAIIPIDFNNQQEVAMIAQVSNLGQHLYITSDTHYILMDVYVETFIKTKLTKEQGMLLGLLVTERLPIAEVAKYMKTSRKTVYSKIGEIKLLWLEYEHGSHYN